LGFVIERAGTARDRDLDARALRERCLVRERGLDGRQVRLGAAHMFGEVHEAVALCWVGRVGGIDVGGLAGACEADIGALAERSTRHPAASMSGAMR
jgi:hypothetical protein